MEKRNGAKRLLGVGVAMMIELGSYLVAAQTILSVTEETILIPSDSTADDDLVGPWPLMATRPSWGLLNKRLGEKPIRGLRIFCA